MIPCYHFWEKLPEDPEVGKHIDLEGPFDFTRIVTQEGVTGHDPSIVDDNGHLSHLLLHLVNEVV
jgi:hypothetical protein